MEFDEFVSKIADEVRAYRGERALVYYFYDNSSRNISALTKEIGRELGLHWYPTKVRNTKQDAKWLNEDDPHIISYRLECPFIQRRVHEMEKIRYRFAINMFIHMHKNHVIVIEGHHEPYIEFGFEKDDEKDRAFQKHFRIHNVEDEVVERN